MAEYDRVNLVDKLVALDETLWNGIGTLTNYASKELGYSKYQLCQVVDGIVTAGLLGGGVYQILMGEHNAVAGGLGAALSLPTYYALKKSRESTEKRDVRNLERGAIVPPKFSTIRPITLAGGTIAVTLGVTLLGLTHYFSEASVLQLAGLANACLGTSLSSVSLREYIISQHPSPPTRKKNILPFFARKIKLFINPQPATTSTVNYQSIDDVITS